MVDEPAAAALPPKPAPSAAPSKPKASVKDWSIPPRKTPTEVPAAALPSNRSGARAVAHHRRWKRIEWLWTIIPILLLTAVAVPSIGLLYDLDTGPAAFDQTSNYHVDVIGAQWYWTFKYTDPYAQPGDALPANATNSQYLYVPQNAVVWLNVSSADVDHDFNVPALGVRIDAIPGKINHYWFDIPAGTAPWTMFRIQCTEFCGQGHYAMWTWLVVTPRSSELPSSS